MCRAQRWRQSLPSFDRNHSLPTGIASLLINVDYFFISFLLS